MRKALRHAVTGTRRARTPARPPIGRHIPTDDRHCFQPLVWGPRTIDSCKLAASWSCPMLPRGLIFECTYSTSRVAERDHQAGDEHAPRRLAARQHAILYVDRREPHFPRKKHQIADADELQRDEHHAERMRDDRESRDGARQPQRFAELHRGEKRQHIAKAVREHACDKRRDAGSRRAGGDDQRQREHEQTGKSHRTSPFNFRERTAMVRNATAARKWQRNLQRGHAIQARCRRPLTSRHTPLTSSEPTPTPTPSSTIELM